MSRALQALALALLALPAAPQAAEAVRVDSAEFARRVDDADAGALDLVGAGLFRWRWFVKVYAAAHYAGAGAPREPAADAPRRLEIAYFVGIAGPRFGEAAEALLERQHGREALSPLRERLERLGRAYRDVRAGDRYTLTYVPGRGTTLALNGEPLALIEGADFARAYFGIWLGDGAIDGGLRTALLGGRAGLAAGSPSAQADLPGTARR